MSRIVVFLIAFLITATGWAQEEPPDKRSQTPVEELVAETQPTAESQPVAEPRPIATEKPVEKEGNETEDDKKKEQKPEHVLNEMTLVKVNQLTLAIDPELLPKQTSVPVGEARSERPENVQQIGQPGKLRLIEGLAWIPRVIFFPLFLVSEYVIRYPLGLLTVWIEKDHVIDRFIDFTSFDEGRGRIAPRVQFYSGFAPSFGLQIAWEDAFIRGNDYTVGADAGFNRNVTVDVATKFRFWDDAANVSLRYGLRRRNDYVFYGIGSQTFEEDLSRFFRVKNTGVLQLQINRMNSGFGAKTSVELSDYSFGCSEGEDDICGLDGLPNTGDDAFPIDSDGNANFFTSGYQLIRYKGLVYWDSRKQRPQNGTGLRFDVFGRIGQTTQDDNIQFARYGGEIAGFLDIFNQRVIGLRFYGELAKPLGDGQIPFGELVTMGGVETMRGFRNARFHGASALVGTIDYRFPVWSFFDGNIFFEAGNTFGDDFDDFRLQKLRPSVGLSMKTINSRYNAIDFTLAFGGTQFDAKPIQLDSVNIGLGTNFGF